MGRNLSLFVGCFKFQGAKKGSSQQFLLEVPYDISTYCVTYFGYWASTQGLALTLQHELKPTSGYPGGFGSLGSYEITISLLLIMIGW